MLLQCCKIDQSISFLAGDGAGGPICGTGMGLRPRARRSRGSMEVEKRAAGQWH